jgi:sarcosine oxidase, subunit gamma
MTTARRLSPIHSELQTLPGTWYDINGMPTLIGDTTPDCPDRRSALTISDRSYLTRFGVKGPGAAAWLEQQGLVIPDRPNTWLPLPTGGLIARLGLTEFLIEDSCHSSVATALTVASAVLPARVYPVLRQDLVIALTGQGVIDLLLQTCNINFRAVNLTDRPVILTTLIGVAVTIIPSAHNDVPEYWIWCDGTFGVYVWQTLLAITQELGGRAIGTELSN